MDFPLMRPEQLPPPPQWAIDILTGKFDSTHQQGSEELPPVRELNDVLKKRISKLPKRARDIFNGKIETDDRSDTSFELACLCAEAGITDKLDIAAIVYHSEPHAEKAAEKSDPERWGWEDAIRCAERALERCARRAETAMFFQKNKFLANRMGEWLKEQHHFVYTTGNIYHYESGYYQADGEELIKRRVSELLGDDYSSHRVREVVSYIEATSGASPEELNKYADRLINVNNGMLDWQTGEMLPHSPEYLSTLRIPVTYNPKATCPNIEKFFNEITTPECVPILEEIFGYALVPGNKYRKAFMLLGTGSNGKSKLLELLQVFIGKSNVSNVPLQKLSERFALADIYGKLANVFSDLPATAVEDSSIFKAITGGDRVMGERKFKNSFYFTPQAKLLFSCNSNPESYDRSDAYYERWIIIPFPNKFVVGENADENLLSKLTTESELSGLLNKALDGLRRLHAQKGFSKSEAVAELVDNYKMLHNPLAMFINDRCDIGEPGYQVTKEAFYTDYERWCYSGNIKPLTRTKFNKAISEQYPQIREVITEITKDDGGKTKARVWRGVRLKTD